MFRNKIAISKNYIISISVICLILFAFTNIIDTVSASDIEQNDDTCGISAIDEEDKLENSQTDEVLQKTWNFNGLSYSELQDYLIYNVSDGDTLYLEGEFQADKEDTPIYLYKNVTITSNSKATFNGKNMASAFVVQDGCQGSVFSNLIFKNGKGLMGGAMYITGSDITIKNCEFLNNYGTFSGGAVYSSYDVITTPEAGKNIVVDRCKFINNSAANAAGALGLFGDKVKVTNTIFESNFVKNSGSAMVYGGAIQVGRSETPFTALIKNCSFIKNSAISSPGGSNSHGGAGCVRDGTTYENCIFIGNSADHGGALTYHGSGKVKNCTFKDNTANLFGGALSTGYVELNMNLTIVDSKFSNNSAPYGGAAQLNGMGIVVDACDFTDNHVSIDGGAVYLNAETTTIKNTDFTGNYAQNNGGAVFVNSKSTNIERSNFKHNTAIASSNTLYDGLGGAIYINGTTNTVQYNVFENNVARNGSAIYNDKSSKNLNVKDNTMTKNQAWVYALPIYAEDISYGESENFGAVIYGGNNIAAYNRIDVSNAIYNAASFNFITVNSQVPKNGATNTGELYQDGREYNVDVRLTVKHSNGTVVYDKVLKSSYFGEVSDVLSNLNPGTYTVTANHAEDDYYKAISNTTTFTVKPKVDISITKTAEDKIYRYHDEVTWYIEAENKGPNDATGVNVTDILPDGLVLEDYTALKGTYSNGIWKIGDLKANEKTGIYVKTKIIKTGNIQNSAYAISAENDTDMSNNNASYTITVEPAIDLAISKKANKTNPNYGDSVKWTIIITNKGIDKATNVTIKDILPAGLVLADGSHEYQLFVGNLNVNQSFTTEIITYVNATGIIKNTASVSGSEYDIDSTNNEISESISVGKATDLEIKKTASNANPKLNDSVDWTITVKNNGPNDATNVKITDILPSGLNYVSSTPSKGRYSNSIWNIDNLNVNEVATLTITTKISKTGLIINTANVTSDEFDIDKSNNKDNYSINVSPACDLGVVKSVNNSSPNYGDLVKWTVTVTNNGPDTAHNISVVDCLPEGLVIVNGNTNYFAESLGALKSVSFDFVTLVNKTGLLINRVNVTGSEFDYNLANNNASSSVNVALASDLAVVKSVNNSSPRYGDLVTWTVAVTNNGPDVAHNVSICDVLPVGLVIVSGNANHFVESLGVLESVSFDYVTLVNKTGMIVNTVNVTSDEYDFNKSNNRDNSSINVSPASDLAVVKIANNSHPNYGDLVKWTVTVINYGPDTAHNISVVDCLPEGLVIINGNTNYFVESLGVLESVSFDFVTLVNKTGLLINRVNVTCSEFDYNLTNNNASSSVNVLPASDLAVVKSVNNSAPYYGDLVKWTVAVTNNGPDTAHNVSISDVLPDGLVIVSGNANHFIDSLGVLESVSFDFVTLVNKTGLIVNTVNVTSDEHDFNKSNNRDNCSINVSPASDLAVVKLVNNSSPSYNDLVKWTVTVTNYGPDIAHNVSISDVLPEGLVIINGNTNYFVESLGVLESVSFDFVTLVNKTGLLVNRVNVTGSEFDYNLTNNNASALVNVLSASDLAVVKSVNNSHQNYGDLVAWTVAVTNNGPNIAHNVSISDMLPEGLVVISGKPNQFIESLGVLELVSFDYVTLVNKTGLIVNAVNVTSDEYDFNKSNNWDNCSIDVSPASDLGVVKSVNNSHPNYEDLITWTVVVTNYGPDTCHNITVSDVLPEGLVIISGTTDYFVESLGVLDSVSFDFVTLVNKTGSFINNVNVNGSEFDYNLDNNNASCTVNVSPACDLEIIKSVNNTNPNYLDNIKWIITLTNNGPDTASNVRVNEVLPSSLKLISYNASKGYFEDNTWIIDELAINSPVYLEITTQVVQTGNITNIVNASSDEYDYNPSNNVANKSVSLNPAIDLKVTKTVNNTAPKYNELINWTITVTNNGPDKANNIVITDKLPEGLLLVNYTATKGYYDEGVWKYCCVEVGEIVTLEITTKVVRTGEFTNNVSGSADEYDYNKSNNYDSQSIDVLNASNLQIIKSVNQSEVNYHDLVKWTLIVRNNGPDDATNVVVNEALPYGLTLISTSDENYSNGIWHVGNIAAGQSKQLDIITRIDATGTINNIVNVTGDQYDEDPTDNNDNKSITIPPVADLSIVKTVSNQKYNVGELIEYIIEISNNGPDIAENITVNEILDGSLTLDSVMVSSGYYDYVNNVWNIESLGNGEKARLIVKAIAEKEGFVSNKVNVSSNTIDDNLNNNYGECIVEIVKKSANITKSGASTVKSKLTKSNVKSHSSGNAANHRVELKSTGIPISLLIFISLISLAFCNINILKKR